MARCFTLLGTSLAENFITIFITTRRNREVLRTFNLAGYVDVEIHAPKFSLNFLPACPGLTGD